MVDVPGGKTWQLRSNLKNYVNDNLNLQWDWEVVFSFFAYKHGMHHLGGDTTTSSTIIYLKVKEAEPAIVDCPTIKWTRSSLSVLPRPDRQSKSRAASRLVQRKELFDPHYLGGRMAVARASQTGSI